MRRGRARGGWPGWLRLRAGGLALAALALAGCENAGVSGVEAELARSRAEGGFSVVESRPDRVVFAARGQQIVVEPPAGYCLDNDAVEVTRRSAFALVTDCLGDRRADVAKDSGEGEVLAIELPRGFPGILTVSVSGESALGPEPAALDDFETLLGSEAGRKLLSRGNNGAAGTVVATRRVGRALYVLVEEGVGHPTFLAPRFWRGFIEINKRLVLVTISGFSDRPIAEDGLMAFLASQMAQLRKANGMDAAPGEDEIAGQLTAGFVEASDAGVAVVRSARQAVTEDGVAPARAPNPPARYAAVTQSRRGEGGGSGGAAPERAPAAPKRPG